MIIYGSGGHGKVIAEAITASGNKVECFLDDNPKSESVLEIPLKKFSTELIKGFPLILAFGNSQIRKEKAALLKDEGFGIAIHPLAYIAPTAKIGHGSVVLLKSAVNTSSKIGKHCIINTGAIVDHDCIIGDFTHIAPNATLCGHVEVGEGSLIGSGVTITPGVKIGSHVKIAAGLTVSKDIPDNQTIFANHV